ncbi:hypothetical protein Agub_g5281, partial [Astrephomene gubernaculifera]
EECEPHSTPLHLAAARGDAVAVRELLLHFASREDARVQRTAAAAADPRLVATLSGRLAWQLALPQLEVLGIDLLQALHPTQPLLYILAPDADVSTSAASNSSAADYGPPSLAAIAAAALKQKLLASLAAVEVAERKAAAEAEAARVLTSAPVPPRPHLSGCRTLNSSAAAASATASTSINGLRGAFNGRSTNSGYQASESLRLRAGKALCRSKVVPYPSKQLQTSRQQAPEALHGSSPSRGVWRDAGFPNSAKDEPHPFGVQDQETYALELRFGRGNARGRNVNSNEKNRCYHRSYSAPDSSSCYARVCAVPFNQGGLVVGAEGVETSSEDWEDVDDEEEDDGICSVCFARPEAAAPATCHHGICSVCAGELCRAVSSRPLLCPFCRQPVTDFVRVAAPAGGAAAGRRGRGRG